jgi:hypothetical protein
LALKRLLHPKLKAWFDARLLNPTPLPFELPYDPVKMFLLAALSTQGITEEGGNNAGALVEWFQSTIGEAEHEAWCLGFVQSCVAYVETYGFKSGLFPTEHCLTAWSNSACMRPVIPQAGDVIIYRFGDTTMGHAAIIRGINLNTYDTIEGNTSPLSKGIEREGDGIYLKTRPFGGIGKMREVGFLRPFSLTTA